MKLPLFLKEHLWSQVTEGRPMGRGGGDARRILTMADEANAGSSGAEPWDGNERRASSERRVNERRTYRQAALLDTRARNERRRHRRRHDDALGEQAFSFKA